MGNSTSSVGVEIECLVAVQRGAEPRNRPRKFQTSKGNPIIAHGDQFSETAADEAIRQHLLAVVRGHEGDRVIGSEDQLEDENAWHLAKFSSRWNVERDVSVEVEPGFLESDPNSRNFVWVDCEITSPALRATEKSWAEIHHVVTTLLDTFWIFAPSTAGLHIHYGRGRNWIPVMHLRKIAALLYAADPVLTQMHPPNRREAEKYFCMSNRLYCNLAHGIGRREAEALIQAQEQQMPSELPPEVVPEPQHQDLNPEPRPTRERGSNFISIFPRGVLEGYTFNKQDFDVSYTQFMHGRDRLPESQWGKPLDIIPAARELLFCETGPVTSLLMQYCFPNRMAYNFKAYNHRDYRKLRLRRGRPDPENQPKRTLEFRQPTGTVDADEVVAHAKIVVRLCEWASSASISDLWKVIVDLSQAETQSEWYDVFDLLVELDLVDEARVIQRQMANQRGLEIIDEMRGLTFTCIIFMDTFLAAIIRATGNSRKADNTGSTSRSSI
ncbi:hypothetical protein F4781DRAFT_440228 [Annulohypoxylon bovei var. microspora]|nr:hypothetical protein F4781DRAFT_440228 [Annulohypoxylon bovei var. microspora]